MFVASFFAALASTSFVVAQQIIKVGGPNGSPVYSPSNVNATKGSVITFQFSGSPGNHSVTQSTLNAPCTPVANGFDSGWVAFNGDAAQAPTWNLTITDDSTRTIWFYCKQLHTATEKWSGSSTSVPRALRVSPQTRPPLLQSGREWAVVRQLLSQWHVFAPSQQRPRYSGKRLHNCDCGIVRHSLGL
ncbi:hypothetical protein GGX14DRAFT_462110, partial [Mycena pura]